MDRRQRTAEVRRLLDEAGGRSGADDAWLIPLVVKVRRRLDALLGCSLSDARLVALLDAATEEHALVAPERPWSAHIAELLVERFVPEPNETYTLYYVPGCPACRGVLGEIDRLGVDVELCNLWENHRFRHEILQARASTTVPALRCSSEAGERWVVDARDIVATLVRRAVEAEPLTTA